MVIELDNWFCMVAVYDMAGISLVILLDTLFCIVAVLYHWN
jgi:hypothetical protein